MFKDILVTSDGSFALVYPPLTSSHFLFVGEYKYTLYSTFSFPVEVIFIVGFIPIFCCEDSISANVILGIEVAFASFGVYITPSTFEIIKNTRNNVTLILFFLIFYPPLKHNFYKTILT